MAIDTCAKRLSSSRTKIYCFAWIRLSVNNEHTVNHEVLIDNIAPINTVLPDYENSPKKKMQVLFIGFNLQLST